jgi:hypothetical protein
MSVMFAFAFDSPERAEAARLRLIAGLYEVEVQPQADGSIVLAVVPPEADADPELVQARLQSIVEPLGGESLGYGGFSPTASGDIRERWPRQGHCRLAIPLSWREP